MRSAWIVEPCIISSFPQMAGKEVGLPPESFLLQIKLQSYSWLLTSIYILKIREKNKVMNLQTVLSLQTEISRKLFPPTGHCGYFSVYFIRFESLVFQFTKGLI